VSTDTNGKARRVGISNPELMPEQTFVSANGKQIPIPISCSIEEFLRRQGLSPRSVVIEHNGEAVAPSEFAKRRLQAGDRLEIVKIVAGG